MCLHRHPPLPRQTCHTVHGAKYVCIYTHTYRFSSVSLSHTVSHTRSILEMMTREIRATEKREKKNTETETAVVQKCNALCPHKLRATTGILRGKKVATAAAYARDAMRKSVWRVLSRHRFWPCFESHGIFQHFPSLSLRRGVSASALCWVVSSFCPFSFVTAANQRRQTERENEAVCVCGEIPCSFNSCPCQPTNLSPFSRPGKVPSFVTTITTTITT